MSVIKKQNVMLLERLLRCYPEFGHDLMTHVFANDKMELLAEIQSEHLEEMEEYEEWGSSDLACWTWEFANDCIRTFNLPYECKVEDHKYKINALKPA